MTQATADDEWLLPDQREALAVLDRTPDDELQDRVSREGCDVEALVAAQQACIHARLARCVRMLERAGLQVPASVLEILPYPPQPRTTRCFSAPRCKPARS